MNGWIVLALAALCLVGVGLYAGSETASYSISRVRIELEARQGSATSRLIRRLLANDTALLTVMLLGNTLMVEVITWCGEDLATRFPLSRPLSHLVLEALLGVTLTPLVFFLGDLLPKELARRRPHAFLHGSAWFLALSRIVFFPLERLLGLVVWCVARLLRLPARALDPLRGREAVLALLREGRAAGALPPQAEELARNALRLRSIPLSRAMVPWPKVRRLERGKSEAELYRAVASAPFTRLPVVDAGGAVLGYVHQLDVLGDGPEEPVLDHLREVLELAPDVPVDRALARLRAGGQRLAVVGTREKPLGLLSLTDLLEEISGDLVAW